MPQLQTSRSNILAADAVDQTTPTFIEGRQVLDVRRVKTAEQALHDIVVRLRPTKNDPAEDSRSNTALDDIWQAFSQLAQPDRQHLNDGPSAISLLDLPIHQFRRLAPFAPFVANVIDEYMSAAPLERNDMLSKAAQLSQWCLISSILFGTPPILDAPLAVPGRQDRSTQSSGQHSLQEIPQSRWPAKSTNSRTPVQPKSKLAQAHEIESCQNVCFTLLSAVGNQSPSSANGSLGGSAAATMTFIEDTLGALDINIQAFIARQKNQDKSRHLLHLTIQERATKPVVDLVARWIEASRLLQNGGNSSATAVSGGMAAVPRLLYRESMRDIAGKLRHRLKNDLVDDNQINSILGSCLLEKSENIISRLHRLMKHRNKDELLFLWQSCSAIIKAQSDNEIRTNIISLFLTTSLANLPDTKSPSNEIQAVLAEIYSVLPKPTPSPVYHSLLSLYAGINTTTSPDHQETGNTVLSSQASLQNLLATWSRMKAEKVTPDIKAYTILMTGLGKKGDYQGLQRVWEELVNDAGCKALWQEEEGTGKWFSFEQILRPRVNKPSISASRSVSADPNTESFHLNTLQSPYGHWFFYACSLALRLCL